MSASALNHFFRTCLLFKEAPLTAGSVGMAFGSFLKIFFGSFLVGAFYGLMSSLLHKKTLLRDVGASDILVFF